MAITLGKDCTVFLDGGIIASARNVTLTETARTIDVNEYGSRYSTVYSTGYECSVSVELNDVDDLGSAFSRMHTGTSFAVSGGAGSFSFQAIITSITESDPLDGASTFTIEGRMTRPGIR
jgi:hypothetical protein